MNAAPLDSIPPDKTAQPGDSPWSIGRLIAFIVLVFVMHIGLIYGLSNHKPIATRPTDPTRALQISAGVSELQLLEDPTVFALPHPKGFAGSTWLRTPQRATAPFHWTEPPRLLALSIEQLGQTFLHHIETNNFERQQVGLLQPPQTAMIQMPEIEIQPARQSTLRINGGLANRKLIKAPTTLTNWPSATPLTNTVLQVLVDADGWTFPPTIITSSGSKPADQEALIVTGNIRFAPAVGAAAKLTIGTLIFEWQTAPLTNAATAPSPE